MHISAPRFSDAQSGSGNEHTHEHWLLTLQAPISTWQILQTDLHTFPLRISWENLFEDQSIFRRLITLLIPTTFYLDYVLTSLGENELWSLLGLKGLDAAIYQWLHISSHTDVLGVSSRVPSLRIGWFSGNLQPISSWYLQKREKEFKRLF